MIIKILAFSGSSRSGSLNQMLLNIAIEGAREAGAEITKLQLSELQLPIYCGDLEDRQGLPDGALKFKTALAEHHAFLIATPEYNGGYTALLKNALDWASRPSNSDKSGIGCYADRPAAMVSASPGLLGAIRSQISLQTVLHKLGMHVIPASFALGNAHQLFDSHGEIKNPDIAIAVKAVGVAVVEAAKRHVIKRPGQ